MTLKRKRVPIEAHPRSNFALERDADSDDDDEDEREDC